LSQKQTNLKKRRRRKKMTRLHVPHKFQAGGEDESTKSGSIQTTYSGSGGESWEKTKLR
jgi:hypothetical protein